MRGSTILSGGWGPFPMPAPCYSTEAFKEQKLRISRKVFLPLSIIRCLLKWRTLSRINMRIRDFFGVFLVLLDTSAE